MYVKPEERREAVLDKTREFFDLVREEFPAYEAHVISKAYNLGLDFRDMTNGYEEPNWGSMHGTPEMMSTAAKLHRALIKIIKTIKRQYSEEKAGYDNVQPDVMKAGKMFMNQLVDITDGEKTVWRFSYHGRNLYELRMIKKTEVRMN